MKSSVQPHPYFAIFLFFILYIFIYVQPISASSSSLTQEAKPANSALTLAAETNTQSQTKTILNCNAFSSDSTPTFSWELTASATNYHFILENTNNTTTPLINTYGQPLTVAHYTMTASLANGTYRWRVRAEHNDGWNDWSEFCYLTLGVPQEVPSVPNLNCQSYAWEPIQEFDWQESDYTTNYQFLLYNKNTPNPPLVNTYGAENPNSFYPNELDLPDGTYVWLVRSNNALGWSSWSNSCTVEIGPEKRFIYLPLIVKPFDFQAFKFSFSGSNDPSIIDAVMPIPSSYTADPYIWNNVPNENSTTQMIRACHGRSGQGYCWDESDSKLVTNVSTSLAQWASKNRGQVWLIGNEPDNFRLEDGDGLTPEDYGKFYVTTALIIKQADPSAKVVFCQSTRPENMGQSNEQFPHNSGPIYCEDAYYTIKELLPSNMRPRDVIDVVAIHNYHRDFYEFKSLLIDFASWVNGLDNGELNQIPLYLTEYGILNNRCNTTTTIRVAVDQKGGVACSSSSGVNYGRNSTEGFWGLQSLSTAYFLSSENTQWKAAWWFFSGCSTTHNISGGLLDGCNSSSPKLSRTGETFRNTLTCKFYKEGCPVAWNSRDVSVAKANNAEVSILEQSAPTAVSINTVNASAQSTFPFRLVFALTTLILILSTFYLMLMIRKHAETQE